jgi:hypothetical protein
MKLERPVFEVRPPVESLDVHDAMGYRIYDSLGMTQRKENRKNGIKRQKTIGMHLFFGTDFKQLDSKARELIKRGFPCCWIEIVPFLDDWTNSLTHCLRVADYDGSREYEIECDEDLQNNDIDTYRYCGYRLHQGEVMVNDG